MARVAFQRIVLCLAATGWLSGCVEGTASAPAGGAGTAAQVPTQARSGKAGEVEAPEVFQTTDSALWDGRPSLGGIWVASPEAVDPERVVMVNVATGKTVAGALFRRERDNPGPTLQVSSDAADALGMLAGQPTELRVTALRKVEKEAPVAVAPVTDVAADAADGDDSAAETAALAAAALAATSADPKADTTPEAGDGAGAEGAAVAASAVAAGAVAADATTDAEPAKPKTWKERRAEAKAKRAADKAAAAAALAGDDASAAGGGDGGAPTVESAGVAAVETAPLDARSSDVAAAAEAATDAPPPEPVKKTRKEIRAEEKAAKEAAAAAEAAAATPVAEAEAEAAVAPAGRPIQVASFSKEENANRAIEALAKIGITATPQKSEQAGKIVWGVVATGDDTLLKSIKGAGFADAYFLK